MLNFPSHRQLQAQRLAAIWRIRPALTSNRLVTLFERVILLAATQPDNLAAIESTVDQALRGEHRPRRTQAKAQLGAVSKSEAS